MQIMPSSGLSDNEIENMVKAAEQHAAEDAKRKESVEAKNTADAAVYSAEKFIADNGANLPEAQKAAVQSQIDALKSAISGDDPAAMKATTDKLQAVLQEAGAAMYQQQQQAPGAGPAPDGDGTDEDVIEGEFSDA